jgi:hypothetical protein
VKNVFSLFNGIPIWIWAVLVLLLLTLFYYHPLILHPASMQAGYDMISYYYPYWQFIKEHNISDGELPLWNDSILCGTTIIGNAHFSFYYPPNWLFLKLPFPIALHIWYAIHIFLAGLGCYLFSRYHKLRRLAAIYGSIIFMFGAHIAVRINIGHYDHISAMAWIPFSFLFLNKLLDESNLKNSLLFGLLLGIHLLTLHLQIFYFSLLGLVIFTISVLILKWKENGFIIKKFLTFGRFAIFSGVIAVGLASAQLLSVLQSVPYSHRGERTYEMFSRLSLPPLQALGLFFSDLWGTDATYAGAANYWELSCFIGVSSIFAIIWAFKKKNPIVISLMITGVISLLFSMGKYTPLGKLLYHMPFMSYSRIPARFLAIIVFALAACSAFGINNLTESLSKKKTREKLFITSLAIAILLISVFYLLSIIEKGRVIQKIFYPLSNNPEKMISIFKYSVIRTLVILAVIWTLLTISKWKKIKPVFITAGLVLVLFVELWIYNVPLSKLTAVNKLEEGFNRLKILKPEQPSDKFRVLGVEFLYQRGLYKYGIERFDGYEPLIEKHLFMIYMNIERQLNLDHPSYLKFLLYATELANTKYLIFRSKLGIHAEDWFRRGTIAIKGNRYQVFQTNNYNPRAYFSDTLQRGKDIGDFYSFVMRKDYKKAVYTENESAQGSNRIEKIDKVKYSPNKVTLSFKCNKKGILVLNDVLFPGWKAYLDNKRTDILRVNYAFRGVKVGPGEHILEFVYKPNLLNIGRIISLLTVIVLFFSVLSIRLGFFGKR